MHNFKLRETARKVYHTQQALKDFQTSTPGKLKYVLKFFKFSLLFSMHNPLG